METSAPSDGKINDYLLNHVNKNISEDEKKFNVGNIASLKKKIGWNPLFIGEYLDKIDEYTDVEGNLY